MVKLFRWAAAAIALVVLLLMTPSVDAGGDIMSSSSEEADDDDPGVVEMVFSFDTTGSMYPVIAQVRQVVSDMIHRLQSDIPGIRIAVFAHGDWQDAKKTYASTWVDFTTDVSKLQQFVAGVKRTSGGDLPEAYELVLHQVSRELSWTHGSRRSLVMIGDNVPHEADYHANVLSVNWRDEADLLKTMGVRIYAIRALEYNSDSFYRTLARKTDGVYLKLDDFHSIIKFIMAISYREHGLEYLEAYEAEVRKQGMTEELENLFRMLRQNPVRRSTRAQVDPTKAPSVGTTVAPSVLDPEPDGKVLPPSGPKVRELHVTSDISFRFATTSVTSRLTNSGNVSAEASFHVVLPKAAFITNFTMILGGLSYAGEVKEKEVARRTYDAARARGESAGHVAAVPRDTNKFKVSVNLASESDVTFVLVYEELLTRRLGVYRHVIHIDAGHMVSDLQVVVNVHESRDLTYLHVPEQHGELLNAVGAHTDNPLAMVTRPAPNRARIAYRPTPEQQKDRAAAGVHGKFVIEYDVTRTRDVGEVQVVDGYFVHYLAPDGLPPAPKSIMFVLDSSGSMYNRKLTQLKAAMKTILEELRPGDYFNLIHFADFVGYWRRDGLAPATEENRKDAQRWVRRVRATGATNINLSLQRGMEMLQTHAGTSGNTSIPTTSLLVFLTDGEPTEGVTNTARILDNARALNQQKVTLFSLGFGKRVNFPFLTKLSLQNGGFARRIYEDADAALQLAGFYTEVGTPTLSRVHVKYLGNEVDNGTLTPTSHRTFFDGGEIVITGQLNDPDAAILNVQVEADSVSGPWAHRITAMVSDREVAPPSSGLTNHGLERVWAYLTIKGLLDRSVQTTSSEEKAELRQRVLHLSLKYHFVTPLTSMVVVKPDAEEVEDVKDSDEEKPEEVKPTATSGDTSKSATEVSDGGVHLFRPSLPRGIGNGSSSVARSMSRSSGPRAYADSDPHFIVNIKGSPAPICFDVMGVRGQIFNLVYDPTTDIVVNGLIVGKKTTFTQRTLPTKDKPRTYFGKIAVHNGNTSVIISPLKIRHGKTDINWRTNMTIHQGALSFTLVGKNKVKVKIGDSTDFVVMRHLVRGDHPVKVSFLGFYIDDDRGLSAQAHGLLGQFKQLLINVNKDILDVKPKSSATLRFTNKLHNRRPDIQVTAGHRENLVRREVVPCWFVHNNGRKLLDGRHLDYLVPHISYRHAPPSLLRKGILGRQGQ